MLLTAGLDGRRMGQLVGVFPSIMAAGELVCRRRSTKPLARAGWDVFERGKIGALAVAGAPVAGANGIGKQGRFEGRAHESAGRVWEVGGRRRRVGEDISLGEAFSAHLLLDFRLDGVEGEVFPAVLCLKLGEGEAVLQATSNLQMGRKKRR